jgi:hypothetical protein
MHSDTNVNVRAARNLVNTVHASREQQQSALATLERDIARKDQALRRLRTAGNVAPGLLATAVVAVVLAAGWVFVHMDRFHPHGAQMPVLVLLFLGVPTVIAIVASDLIERRVVAASLRLEHLRAKRVGLQRLIGRMNVTVKESEQELAAREQASA